MEIVTDERGGLTVMRDGHPQSYVDLDDPELLVFEYIQHLALVIDAMPAGPLRVTHIGGAGLTLPRFVNHTRPESPQIVMEPDEALTALVRRDAPLPRRHRIRVRPQTGAQGLPKLADGSADAIVLDAFADGVVPADLLSAESLGHVARALAPGGIFLANVPDEPGLRFIASVVTTMRQWWPHVGYLALTETIKGRRFGNVVLVASASPLPEVELVRAVARTDFPTTFRGERSAAKSAGTAKPLPAQGVASPLAPDAGSWRVR
ncbi:fused MFS/spermidine synthase [Ornithinimicrobium sp. Arc0846-15]|nr:fused MFS/spermidine synthase [Ornithinimicrobium laminariae]